MHPITVMMSCEVGQAMQAILSSVMAVTLLVQGVFGCCRFGAVPHGQVNCKAQTCAVAACSQCKHADHHSGQQQPLAPCKCNVECRGVCAYVSTSKVHVEKPCECQ